MSEAPRGTTQGDILSRAKDHLWDINAAYMLDCENITRWLEDEAKTKFLPQIIAAQTIEEKRESMALAIQHYKDNCDTHLEKLCNLEEKPVDPQHLQDAKDGILQRKAATFMAIVLWFILLLMAAGAEVSFFGFLVFFRDAGFGVMAVAITLLLGGLFTGYGVSHLIERSKEAAEEKKEHIYKHERKYIYWAVGGIMLIAGSVGLRWVYGGPLAGIVALFFGFALIMTEIIWSYNRWTKKYYMKRMFQAQHYFAALQLRKDLGDKNKPYDGTWIKMFKSYIETSAKTVLDIGIPSQ
ncbi:MAG: hypothetical protein HY805_06390 [Nitrospirae bacterium]|nr:hypothetical protein [Nitrospirota bacterium]